MVGFHGNYDTSLARVQHGPSPDLISPFSPSAHLITLYPSPRTRFRDDCAFNHVILDRHNRARRWISVFFQFSLFISVIFKALLVRKHS